MEDTSKHLITSVGTVDATVLQFIHISESRRRRMNITVTSNCRHTGSFYLFKVKKKKIVSLNFFLGKVLTYHREVKGPDPGAYSRKYGFPNFRDNLATFTKRIRYDTVL